MELVDLLSMNCPCVSLPLICNLSIKLPVAAFVKKRSTPSSNALVAVVPAI